MLTRKFLVLLIACLVLLAGVFILVASAAKAQTSHASETIGLFLASNDAGTILDSVYLPIVKKGMCGEIKVDTTWGITGSPYQITCDVTVPTSITLTIEAGVIVQFTQPDADLIIRGTLQASGTQAAPIRFQPLSETKPGSWGQLAFMSNSSGALDHAILESGGSGSGMVYIASDAVRVENSIVQYSANTGIYIHTASPLISGTQILTNTAPAGGGGIYNDTGNPIIQGNIFRYNSTSGYSYAGGGGIYNGCGNPTIQNNRFIGNIAEYDSPGGGLYSGCGRPLIQNNIFAGNVAKGLPAQQYSQGNQGGGIFSSGDPIIQNNIFTGNIAEYGFNGIGGALYIDSDNAMIRNNIIINNDALTGSGIYNAKGASPDYNDLWNNDYAGGTPPGTHNISADPLLVDPANSDFHLASGSPCIDTGDPVNYPPTDFEGDPRPMGATPDIGADEYRTLMVATVGTPEETSPGGTITYAVKLTNLDKLIMANVLLTDTLSAETAYIGYQADGLTCAHDGSAWGGLLSCALGSASLAPGESRALTLTVKVTDTLPAHTYVEDYVKVTAHGGGKTFLASDWTRTWVSECEVRINDMPMGRDLQAAIDASKQITDVVKVYGYCHIHDLLVDKTLILQGSWSRDFSQWNPTIYTTTLDGQGQGQVIEVDGDVNPTIEGFVITGGNGVSGGGVFISSGNPTIQKNTFTGNTAYTSGGGLYNDTGNPTIQDNTFVSNTTSCCGGGLTNSSGSPIIQHNTFANNSGWGLYNSGSSSIQNNSFVKNSSGGLYNYSNPLIQNNSFSNNSGPGLYNNMGNPLIQNNIFSGNSSSGLENSYGSPIIESNTFINNSAGSGGGLHNWGDWGDPIIENNKFSGNYAINGGGLFNASYGSSRPIIQNNIFYSNTANEGGGLEIWAGNPIIQNNTFTNNSANEGGGLAIYNDAPATENSTPVIQNNIFSGNSADNGGGLEINNGNPIIQNNTFTGNLASIGGGIHIGLNSSPTIGNNILVNNAASNMGGGLYNNSNVESLPIDYNDVWNSTGGDYYGINPGVHDIHADPLLVDPENSDFHLAPGSPCIDAGDPVNYTATDFEGDLRPMGLAPDIGADEYRNLRVGKSSIPDEASPGAVITYTISLMNPLPFLLQDVFVTDTLPSETKFTGYQADGLTCTHDGSAWGGQLSCVLDNASLAPGERQTLTMTVLLTATFSIPRSIVNPITAVASASGVTYNAYDQAWTWVRWCKVQLNNSPMEGDLQAAINASDQHSDVIKVSGECRVHDLNLNKPLTLQGGWSWDFSQWNPRVYTTTLDGQGFGRVIEVEGDVAPTIERFIITGGINDQNGGGIYNNSGSPIIRNNTFTNNNVSSLYYVGRGGGLYNHSGNPIIENNIFIRNSTGSNFSQGEGGGLYNFSGNPIIQNNDFNDNKAESFGGGVYNRDGNPIIQNNTFTDNSAGTGGGLYISGGSPIICSNIIINNIADDGGGLANSIGTTPTLGYNDAWNNIGGDYSGIAPGIHDISANPLLVDPANGDFHLASGSPCIDAGDPVNYPPTDFEGDPRPIGLAPDIGADEFRSQIFFLRFLYLSIIIK